MSKKLYFLYIDDPYEYQGMFDDNHVLVGYWSLDDADWRHEYFSGAFAEIGVEIIRVNYDDDHYDEFYQKLKKQVCEDVGEELDEEEE